MKHEKVSRWAVILIAFLTTISVEAKAAKEKLQGSKPNIILVMTDDQGYGDLACHGHPYLKTPDIDKLHSQSTRFTDFPASPTCAPTRAALMSGRAPFKNGVIQKRTLPMMMRQTRLRRQDGKLKKAAPSLSRASMSK